MKATRVEYIERAVLAMVAQALSDYRHQAVTIFREETDSPQDIAEDVLREAIDAMGLSQIHERLYGKADLKKAIYVFVPNAEPVALMLDAKAEKDRRTATIQMSQTSMTVRQKRSGEDVEVKGTLESFIARKQRKMLVVTVIAKFVYSEMNALERIIVACIPNGLLQEQYNPNPQDTIWLAGRNAPTLGEDFRVRLSYRHLPANREVSKIVAAATSSSPRASELAQLYVERAYCLYREDYLRLKKIDEDIAEISD